MALPKFTFTVPSQKTSAVRYFSICPECEEEHFPNTGIKRESLFQFSHNPADVKYDIIAHALDEIEEAKWTGVNVTQDHIARTWRAKVIKECGQESGCAKLLLSQVRLDLCLPHTRLD